MLTVANLVFERYFQPVFKPVGFELGAGELLVITGANGCGKTTLIRLLAGILQPHAGSCQSSAGKTIYIGHQLAIKDELSVVENIRFMHAFHGSGAMSALDAARSVGLERVRHQPARTLSAGQRKRCALSRLLLSDANLWLLDEPYSNLDEDGIALVDRLLTQHLQIGGSCVLATHGGHRPAGLEARTFEIQPGAEDYDRDTEMKH